MGFVLIILRLMGAGETSQGLTLTCRGAFEKRGACTIDRQVCKAETNKICSQGPPTAPHEMLSAVSMAASNERKVWKHLSHFHHCHRVIIQI